MNSKSTYADRLGTLPSPRHPEERRERQDGIEATVFGLDVRANRRLPFLQGAAAKPTGRLLRASVSNEPAPTRWPAGAEVICDQRRADGGVALRIESSTAGFRIWAAGRGENVISSDGSRLRAAARSEELLAWQRLLVAQVLPFVAVLRGLEVLHASAVVLERGAIALLGHSGSGKTSLALALCRGGAGFLTDDVLSVEPLGGSPIAHGGAPVAAIDCAEIDRLRRSGYVLGEEILSADRREQVAPITPVAVPVPLRALFFLDRQPAGPSQPRFQPLSQATALIASTFNMILTGADRQQRLLDVCALLAELRAERVSFGPGVDPTELAAALRRRLASRA